MGHQPHSIAAPAEPECWSPHITAHTDARVYVGGKQDGTLDATDGDSSRAFLNPPGLTGSASRAALNAQAALYPSASACSRNALRYGCPVAEHLRYHDQTVSGSGPRGTGPLTARESGSHSPRQRAAGHELLTKIPYFLNRFYSTGAPRSRLVRPSCPMHRSSATSAADRRSVSGRVEQRDGARRSAVRCGWSCGRSCHPRTRPCDRRGESSVVNAGAGVSGGYLVVLDFIRTTGTRRSMGILRPSFARTRCSARFDWCQGDIPSSSATGRARFSGSCRVGWSTPRDACALHVPFATAISFTRAANR